MSVNLSLYPYSRKWPRKPTIFTPKREFEFTNFYDFYDDLGKLGRNKISDNLAVFTKSYPGGHHQLTDSGNNFKGDEPSVNYYLAADVYRILKKAMRRWKDVLKKNKDASAEEMAYYKEYMEILRQIGRLGPRTALIVSFY